MKILYYIYIISFNSFFILILSIKELNCYFHITVEVIEVWED